MHLQLNRLSRAGGRPRAFVEAMFRPFTVRAALGSSEGSTDAGAHHYPAIFLEPEFALMEIELYVRMRGARQRG